MRKTSQDGGDSTSITSGFENELKKASVGIMKTKRNSIKRKVQNFSHESDDTVIEPLLQIDKNETANRSAKYLLSKSKTDSLGERDTNMPYSDNNVEKSSVSKYIGTTGAMTINSNITKTLHNHMNTNVFGGHDVSKVVTTAKSPILVEISGCRSAVRSNQSSSIFTTAKIHADNITKNMEPIQVTPVPILSTVEGSVVKAGISPDYAQNKNIIPSTSSSILKPISSQDKAKLSNIQQYEGSHLTRSEDGKPDPYKRSTEYMVKKLSDVLDNRSSISITESESILPNKPLDTKKENVQASSVAKSIESEIVSKITPQLKPSISTISDIKIKSINEHRDAGFKDNLKSIQKISDVKRDDVDGRITLQNQNAFNLKSPELKDDVRKKEDKNAGSTSTGSKQLQRQKNAICESDKLDDVINNDSLKRSKDVISTQSSSTSSGTIMSTSKSKDNLTQSGVTLKSGTEIEKQLSGKTTQVCKPLTENLAFTPITTNEVKLTPVLPLQSITAIKTDSKETKTSSSSSIISKPTDKKSLITATTTKPVTSKPMDSGQTKPSTTSFRSDLAIEKKIVTTSSEIIKPVKENAALIAVTTKEVSPKVIDTVLSKPSTSSVQSDSMLKEKKPTEICKPITENLSTTKGHAQKSTTVVTTTQSTGPTKADSIKENKTVGSSNQTSKFAIDNLSHITGTSKGIPQKPNTAATKSLNTNQSDSVKDNKTLASSVSIIKPVKDKSIKEALTSKPSGTIGDKSPITTDTKGSVKNVQNSKNLPKSKDISEAGASSYASKDLKNTMTSTSHKTDKVQNKTLSDEKSKIPITVMPTNTIPITKTEVKTQPSNVLPSSAKYSVISKVEPTNTSGVKSTTVSSIPTTTNTSSTTLAKSTSQKITSKTNVLDKHGKI